MQARPRLALRMKVSALIYGASCRIKWFDGRTVMPKKKVIPRIPTPGREPTPQYLRSVWATDYIPDWARPATRQAIASAEKRLGVVIPKVLKVQLAVQNGGQVFLSEDHVPFEVMCRHWTNAIVDGI